MKKKPHKRSAKMNWKQWTSLLALGLMLAAMLMYVLSNDEAEPDAVLDTLDPAAAQAIDQSSLPGQPMPAADAAP